MLQILHWSTGVSTGVYLEESGGACAVAAGVLVGATTSHCTFAKVFRYGARAAN